MLKQHRGKFFMERLCLRMLLLIFNVTTDVLTNGWAYGESSLTLLPKRIPASQFQHEPSPPAQRNRDGLRYASTERHPSRQE